MPEIIIEEQLVQSRSKTWDGTSDCTSITIHETANTSYGANAQAHANLQSSGNVRQASWHIQVDDQRAIQSFPDEAMCWHAGWLARHSIAIEICVNRDGDYDQALANAASVVRQLRAKHGIAKGDIRMHHDWTGKNCPSRLRASFAWRDFIESTDENKIAPVIGGAAEGAASMGGGRSTTAMAHEIIAGLHGNGHITRMNSLRISPPLYEQVRTKVNQLLTGEPQPSIISEKKSISTMAAEVIDGKHGSGHEKRRKSLGVSPSVYEQVRAEVNRRFGTTVPAKYTKPVSQMASEILAGLHGNGHETRRRSLGIGPMQYERVREEVNRRA